MMKERGIGELEQAGLHFAYKLYGNNMKSGCCSYRAPRHFFLVHTYSLLQPHLRCCPWPTGAGYLESRVPSSSTPCTESPSLLSGWVEGEAKERGVQLC